MKYIQSVYWILWKKIFKSFPLKNINVNVYSFLGKHDGIIFISNTNKSFKIKSELLVICSILYLYFILNVYSFIKLKFQIPKSIILFVDYLYILYSPNIPVLALFRLRNSAPLLASRSGVWVIEVNWRLMSETLTVSYLLPNLHLPILQPISYNIENATWKNVAVPE